VKQFSLYVVCKQCRHRSQELIAVEHGARQLPLLHEHRAVQVAVRRTKRYLSVAFVLFPSHTRTLAKFSKFLDFFFILSPRDIRNLNCLRWTNFCYKNKNVNVLTKITVYTEPFSLPLANDFLNLRRILYELIYVQKKTFNDEDVNVLTETSVYSEPFQFLSYYSIY
jgi:hypothetical protein